MEKELFYAYLKQNKQLNNKSLSQLKQVLQKYPYFQTAKLMLLKNMQENHHPEFATLLKDVAVSCNDREKLFYYLNDDRYSRFFPDEENKAASGNDRTELLLNSFLASIEKEDAEEPHNSKTDNHWEEDSIISTDYLAYLEKTGAAENHLDDTEEAQPMKHQQLVDRFLEKSSRYEDLFSSKNREKGDKQKPTQEVDNLLDDDTFLTETLAQVYIKQKKYEQALTIIKRLSLNFPKKSIYFADQIRFLEYLIYNDKNKKQK